MDPITGTIAIIGAAKVAADSEAGKTAARLMESVLGRTAVSIGDALGRLTEYRLRNVGRVLEKADVKSRGRSGAPHPRVAHRILDDGSYVEDEVMAEYLSGVLAGSREDPNDDRGVAWAALVASMSTLQIRLHFILYREWAAAAEAHPEQQVSLEPGRVALQISSDLFEISEVLVPGGVFAQAQINHAVAGLIRMDLLGAEWYYGPTDSSRAGSVAWEAELWVQMSPAGMELFAWALGETSFLAHEFAKLNDVPLTIEIPRLTRFAFPRLPPVEPSAIGN